MTKKEKISKIYEFVYEHNGKFVFNEPIEFENKFYQNIQIEYDELTIIFTDKKRSKNTNWIMFKNIPVKLINIIYENINDLID